MTRLLAVPLDASDVFLMTFMILQDSYMEPTRVGLFVVQTIILYNATFMSEYFSSSRVVLNQLNEAAEELMLGGVWKGFQHIN